MRDLVILGNGPSLLDYDLKKVSESYDTIGLNGSFVRWMREGWYPTYQYFARNHPLQWGNGINRYISESYKKTKMIFLNDMYFSEYGNQDNVTVIHSVFADTFMSPNLEKWENSFGYDIACVCERLVSEGMSEDEAKKLVVDLNDKLNPELSQSGIYKVLKGQELGDEDSDDYIKNFRFSHNFAWPTSFDAFYNSDHDHSGADAVKIGYILGYRKMYLLGCDNNYKVRKGTMLRSSYHDKGMFNNIPYRLEEDIPCPICRTTNGLRNAINDGWENMLIAMMENEIDDLEIINCNPKSHVKCFEFDKLPLV